MIDDVEAQLSEIFGKEGEIKLDSHPSNSPKIDRTEVSVTVLQSGCDSRDDLPVEDGITPLEPPVEGNNFKFKIFVYFCVINMK